MLKLHVRTTVQTVHFLLYYESQHGVKIRHVFAAPSPLVLPVDHVPCYLIPLHTFHPECCGWANNLLSAGCGIFLRCPCGETTAASLSTLSVLDSKISVTCGASSGDMLD